MSVVRPLLTSDRLVNQFISGGMKMKYGIFFGVLLLSRLAWATDAAPPCLSHGQAIPVNDAEILNWKHATPNQFTARGHVEGRIQKLYPDINGHQHFEIQIGPKPMDTLEVVSSMAFGTIPNLALGQLVEACGDYITSTAPAGRFPASPDGAIIHWVHRNPSPAGHPSGFVMVDGNLFGQGFY